ncbi:hypothetical protein E4099_14675 [Streptomyces palmae]|uniref:DUF8017 domain-containing protein n=1 Tax=Streptomyces palmae TaxID=1701085 RepID=A0A4Z0H957_9ACTN|nr:hypothetical protein E4099_14675 [Streptomyces palmae]
MGTAIAVVAAATIAGVLLLRPDGGSSSEAGDGARGPAPTRPQDRDPAQGGAADPDADAPRGSGKPAKVKPVIPGWQVVANPRWHNAFDVPPGWDVKGAGESTSFFDENDKRKPLISMSAPAVYKESYCPAGKKGAASDISLAATGTKGAKGAKTAEEAAKNEARSWVFAGYDQAGTGDLRLVDAETKPFTSAQGLKGYTAKAEVTGVKKKDGCATDGKAFTVTFTGPDGKFATWVLYTAAHVEDEVPDATIKKIMSSLRLLEPAS